MDVGSAEVEIAARMKTRQSTRGLFQFVQTFGDDGWIEIVTKTSVWSCDDVGRAIIDSHFEHREAFFKIVCTIVQPPQDVAVDVDQCLWWRI